MSRHWLRAQQSGDAALIANFLPGESQDGLRQKIGSAVLGHPQYSLKRFLSGLVPERFSDCMLLKCGIPKSRNLNQLNKKEKQVLIKNLLEYPLPVTDVFGYAKAEVTAGGVRLDEVDDRTLESKCRPGLFLAGEILDADGRIGGFNFQWAWATGTLAAEGAARHLSSLA